MCLVRFKKNLRLSAFLLILQFVVCYSITIPIGGDVNGLNGTLDFMNALDSIDVNGFGEIVVQSSMYIDEPLNIPNNCTIRGNNATLTFNSASRSALFNLDGKLNVVIKDLTIQSEIWGGNIAVCLQGTTHKPKNIILENLKIKHFDVGIICDNVLKSTFNSCEIAADTGMIYTGKSGDVRINNSAFIMESKKTYDSVNVDNSNIIDDTTAIIGEVGIITRVHPDAISDSNGTYPYPEGLTVNNTLFYRHKISNVIVEDLFIGMFNNCYFDNVTSLDINYQHRNEGLIISNSWFNAYGIHFSRTKAKLEGNKVIRANVSNNYFSSIIGDTTIIIDANVQNVSLNNNEFTGTTKSGQLAVASKGGNAAINVVDNKFHYYDQYVSMSGKFGGYTNTDEFNSNSDRFSAVKLNVISNISLSEEIAEPIRVEYPVHIRNCEIPLPNEYFESKVEIVGSKNFSSAANNQIAALSARYIAKGTVVNLSINLGWAEITGFPNLVISAPGFKAGNHVFPIHTNQGRLDITVPLIAETNIRWTAIQLLVSSGTPGTIKSTPYWNSFSYYVEH